MFIPSEAFRGHQILLNHAKQKRKGCTFLSPASKLARKQDKQTLEPLITMFFTPCFFRQFFNMQLHGVPHANIYVMVFFVHYIVTTLNLCDARKGSSMDFMDTMPMEFDIPQFELEDEYPDSSSNSFLCEGFTGNSCMMMLLENKIYFSFNGSTHRQCHQVSTGMED